MKKLLMLVLIGLLLHGCATSSYKAPDPKIEVEVLTPSQMDYKKETTDVVETGTIQTNSDGSYSKVCERYYKNSPDDITKIFVFSSDNRNFYQEVPSNGDVSTQDLKTKGDTLAYGIPSDLDIITKEDRGNGEYIVYSNGLQFTVKNNYIVEQIEIKDDNTMVTYTYSHFKDEHTKLDLTDFDIPEDISEVL